MRERKDRQVNPWNLLAPNQLNQWTPDSMIGNLSKNEEKSNWQRRVVFISGLHTCV